MSTPDMRELRRLYVLFCELYPFLSTEAGAEGLCRWAALTFADMASMSGVEVSIIRWHVCRVAGREPERYNDHWAVDLDHGRVLDPTYAQVGNLSSPWATVLDYPDNYMISGSVPAHVLLPTYREWVPYSNGKDMSQDVMDRLNQAYYAHAPKVRTHPLRYVAGGAVIAAIACVYLHVFFLH